MAHSTDDRIHELLRRELDELVDETVVADGDVNIEKLERVERLAGVVEAQDTVRRSAVRRRWPVAAVLAATLVIVSLLFFARVSETPVELVVRVSEVGFRVPSVLGLTDVLRLSSLGVSGLQRISLPGELASASRLFSESVTSALHVSVATQNSDGGSITLSPLMLPASAGVMLRARQEPGEYRLSIDGGLDLQVDLLGKVRLASPHAPEELFDFSMPRPVHMRSGGGLVDIDIGTLDAATVTLGPQLPITDLAFLRVDEIGQASEKVVRRISTLVSGKLYFEALNGREYTLRAHEALAFDSVRGEIRALSLRENGIDLAFQGYVGGMRIGAHTTGRSLMPTYLEWLRARHGLGLLWASALYLFGAVITVLRWWRAEM